MATETELIISFKPARTARGLAVFTREEVILARALKAMQGFWREDKAWRCIVAAVIVSPRKFSNIKIACNLLRISKFSNSEVEILKTACNSRKSSRSPL